MNGYRLVYMKRKALSILFAVMLLVAGLATYLSTTVTKVYATEPTKTETEAKTAVSSFGTFSLGLYNEIGLKETGLDSVLFQKALTGYYNLKNQGALSAEK